MPKVMAAPSSAAAPAKAAKVAISLPGRGFTLWTKPGGLEPIRMSNAAPAALVAPAAAQPLPAAVFHAVPAQKSAFPWLAAAAALAIAGIFALMWSSQKGQRDEMEKEAAKAKTDAKSASETAATQLKSEQAKVIVVTSELASSREAAIQTQVDLKKEIDAATANVSAAEEIVKAQSAKLSETAAAFRALQKSAGEKEIALQRQTTELTEQLSALKESSGEELSKAQEAAAKLEAEKSAALKEATEAKSDRDALKVEVEKLLKQLESCGKPAGKPEA